MDLLELLRYHRLLEIPSMASATALDASMTQKPVDMKHEQQNEVLLRFVTHPDKQSMKYISAPSDSRWYFRNSSSSSSSLSDIS